MSPRGHSSAGASTNSNSRSASAPYSRRPAGQPKSSRQQFSACGACRMRRVRCDLKDLPIDSAGPHPACSNCKERGLKCVDEFADVKAVKLLRRGRRLQQVEQIYGKVSDPELNTESSSSSLPLRQQIIPHLQPEFFASPFWRWFSAQRPIFDANEFPVRFFAHAKGTQTLDHEGRILAMILVVWAASFGVDERGVEIRDELEFVASSSSPDPPSVPTSGRNSRRGGDNISADRGQMDTREILMDKRRRQRRERTDAMLREVLELVDLHGVMRRPTWDGVRVLLLILPLMEEARPLDRLAMYEATLAQAHALCTLPASTPGPSSYAHAPDDALVRARIFWYAHVHEGITTALRGGRLVLDEDDLDAFQSTLLPFGFGVGTSGIPSPTSPTFPSGSLPPLHMPSQVAHPHHPHSQHHAAHHRGSPTQSYFPTADLFALPLHLSAVCRKVHAVLTGPKAMRRLEDNVGIDEKGMREVWEGLDQCWEEFDAVRRGGMGVSEEGVDVERFVSAWQIFIFECHNIIREALKQHLMTHSPPRDSPAHPVFSSNSPNSRPSSKASSSLSPYSSQHHFHTIATRKCLRLLPFVLNIIKLHLPRGEHDVNGSALFRWDAGLVRDGCFFAAFLAASNEGDTLELPSEERHFKQEDADGVHGRIYTDEAVDICLRALGEMRWAFSKSEEREETVRMIWEAKKIRRPAQYQPQSALQQREMEMEMEAYRHLQQHSQSAYAYNGKVLHHTNSHTTNSHTVLPLSSISERPLLPPLTLTLSPRRTLVDSAPNTACSADGSASGWPSYTPPGTGTSATTSTGTGISGNGSPVFSSLPGPGVHGFKNDGGADDHFYHVQGDIDHQFSFNVPVNGVSDQSTMTNAAAYHRASTHSSHSIHGSGGSYMGAGVVYTTTGPSVIAHAGSEDVNGCPQFGDDCHGFY